MKTKILLPALFCAFSFLSLPAQPGSDEAAMEQFAREFMVAYNQENPAAIRKMYLDDAVRVDVEGNEINGAERIAAFFAEQFRQNDLTLLIKQTDLSWSDFQHAFLASGTYEVYGNALADNHPIQIAGRYTNTMIQKDGKWKIAKTILSPLEDEVAAKVKMYTELWHAILNEGRLDLVNESNFSKDLVLYTEPQHIVGLEAARAYYAQFLQGFSDIQFTVNEIFGQGNKLVKYWTFEGTHSGAFFGIPPTGRRIVLSGSTIAYFSDGKIAGERDFMDNLSFMQQLGVLSSPGNLAVIEGMYQNFAKGDIPAVLAAMDPAIVWNEAENFPYADGNPYIGPQAVLNGVFSRIGDEWEYWNLTDIQLHEMSNDRVLATLRYQGKYKKNGAVLNAQAAHLWTLKDSKVIGFQQFADTQEVEAAISKNSADE